MQKKTRQIIVISIIIMLAILLILLLQNNGILTRQQNQQLADVGVTTQIGDKQYNITDKIENDIVPTISAGMIPVKQDGEYWTIVDTTDNTWFSYANGVPAYMMLNDGKYQSEEYYQMPDTQEVAKAGTQISKDSLDLGSIYMWVPRYAYNEDGNVIYIKRENVVAGSYTLPDIFKYSANGKEFSLSGMWVELNESDAGAKVNDLNNGEEDTIYGFIAHTKVSTMTEDEQFATQILEEYLMQIAGADVSVRPGTQITTTNHTILKIIDINKLEPIVAIGTCSDTDRGIVTITVTGYTNEIEKIIDEEGAELTLSMFNGNITGVSKSYTTGEHNFYVTDKNNNIKEIIVSVEKNLLMVTYVPNEGMLGSTYEIEEGIYGEEVMYGATVNLPTPTLSGHIFDGWYTTLDFKSDTKANSEYTVTHDVIMYAKYMEYFFPNLEVGDIVNYDASKTPNSQIYTYEDKFKSTDAMKWKVLSIDKTAGTVELIAANDTPNTITLSQYEGFVNTEDILNDISSVYGHGYGALSSRSITIEDIEEYSTYNKTTYEESKSSTGKWGGTRDFTSGSYFYTEIGTKTNGDKIYSTEPETASSSNPITMTQTYYTYDNAINYFARKIGNMLIKDANGQYRSYFLASKCVSVYGSCQFYVRMVSDNSVTGGLLFYARGGQYKWKKASAVCPIVSLNSNIQYIKNSNGEWDIK